MHQCRGLLRTVKHLRWRFLQKQPRTFSCYLFVQKTPKSLTEFGTQDSLKSENTLTQHRREHDFLEQARPHFLPISRQPAIDLDRKDSATVFQRHAFCNIL